MHLGYKSEFLMGKALFMSQKGVAECQAKVGGGASAHMQGKCRIQGFPVLLKPRFSGWRVKGWHKCWSEAMFLGGSSRNSLASARIETVMNEGMPFINLEELTRISAKYK